MPTLQLAHMSVSRIRLGEKRKKKLKEIYVYAHVKLLTVFGSFGNSPPGPVTNFCEEKKKKTSFVSDENGNNVRLK